MFLNKMLLSGHNGTAMHYLFFIIQFRQPHFVRNYYDSQLKANYVIYTCVTIYFKCLLS